MVLNTIDGKPFALQLEHASEAVGNSSTGRATTLLTYYWLISGEADSSVRIGFIRPDGTALETNLTRRVFSHNLSVMPKLSLAFCVPATD